MKRALRQSLIALVLVAAPAALVGSCGGGITSGKACTLIGCDDALTVVLDGAGAANVMRVEATAPGDTARVWNCTTATPCTGATGVWFRSYAPATVVIRLVTDTGSTSYPFTPQYTVSQPNGPGCGPECKSATLHITP